MLSKAHKSIRRMTQHKDDSSEGPTTWLKPVVEDPNRSLIFSIAMLSCGAALGPFLDSYHSAFGVLQYDKPISAILWGNEMFPVLTTTWWVPELFGLAGFLIGWLYIIFDNALDTPADRIDPTPSKVFLGISLFTMQYWLSGILFDYEVDRSVILNIMSIVAALGFVVFDNTATGFIASTATGIGGPLIEVGLIWSATHGYLGSGGYHYNDLGETGFFPLWILPVYFFGGPANGNLARCFWNLLTEGKELELPPCNECNDTRRVPCPNCDGVGTYVAMGGKTISCTSCNGRGFVICRDCFDQYGKDPYDIDTIREMMRRMPD
jgi:hypothetical protein